MRLLLTAFIDGLKPESLKYMSFVNSLTSQRRMRTELGYSVTCYPSMFSGVYPNKHLRWFFWKYSPDTSPCKWVRRLKIDKLPHNMYTEQAVFQIAKLLNRRKIASDASNLPLLWYVPITGWADLDITETKSWMYPGYLEGYPTVFDILPANNVSYEVVGATQESLSESSSVVAQYNPSGINPFTFLFIGDIDPLSHRYGQDSELVIQRLKTIDGILETKYRLFEKADGDLTFILFSDHGHMAIESKVSLMEIFKSYGECLRDFLYIVDSSYARFWFRNERERERVTRVISRMENMGYVLTEELLEKFHVNMPDNRYGDLIFYLDFPHVFTHRIKVFGRSLEGTVVSGHGFLPSYPGMDGVFVSNKEVLDCSHVELVDMMPSILDIFDVEIPYYVDGKVLWSQ